MEFGKLPNVDRVNFGMHPDAAENKDVLGGQPALAFMAYIGPTGYNMKDWVGKWYPAASKDRDFLKAGGVFDDDMIDAYIELKMEEVTRFRMSTHPVEFDMYYSV